MILTLVWTVIAAIGVGVSFENWRSTVSDYKFQETLGVLQKRKAIRLIARQHVRNATLRLLTCVAYLGVGIGSLVVALGTPTFFRSVLQVAIVIVFIGTEIGLVYNGFQERTTRRALTQTKETL